MNKRGLSKRDIRIEEFEPERNWWGKPDKNGAYSKRVENEHAWRVPVADIVVRGYNLDVKNPHQVDETHRDPAELLAEYRKPRPPSPKSVTPQKLEAALLR